ncbi:MULTISPECIES: hypothetical protein [Flavobacterium]|uniref:DNA pilot protein n=1 Tax=Flavobacterium keumense TaxID=1306518 RepID=A0ABY8N2B2_9FLAO|nr:MULTISPECIES: hypothetical protein [Flavobacterium]WGK93785.1 hypothetical protein MG292_06690 [Flavobacterium keumense]
MAAVTSAIIGGIGVGLSAYQAIDGANRSRKAKNELSDYERQTLDNAYKDIQISTMGSDLLREENARTSANLIDATQLGGIRGVIGGIPKIVGTTNQINQQAAQMLDGQVQKRDYAIAQDNARIEGITENRDIANIAGLSSQVETGRQDMWNGFSSALSSAAYLGRGLEKIQDKGKGKGWVSPSWTPEKGIDWEFKTPRF